MVELTENFLIKNIISSKFLIAPHARLLPHQLSKAIFQNAVKVRNPTFLIIGDRQIVDMSIADK